MGSWPLRLACMFIAGLMAMPVLARSAPAPRLALVIGNGAYTEFSRLVNPVNDARLMATTLRGLGFEVVLRTNANRDAMITAVRKFVDQIKSAGREAVVLFYFAGHGVESKGSNYLIPLGVEIPRLKDLDDRAVAARRILVELLRANPALTVMILDACRNNSFPQDKSSGPGLGEMRLAGQRRNAIIAFAAAPRQRAQDGPPDGNSPYTGALVDAMKSYNPPLEVGEVFTKTSHMVSHQTKRQQEPWTVSRRGPISFYFRAESPGVYLAVNVTARQRIELTHLRVVRPELILPEEINDYSHVKGGCYSRSIQSGDRLGWEHVSADCSR